MHRFRQEGKWLAAGFVLLCIAVFIAFHKSGIVEVLKITAALYWMFVLPGYALFACSKLGFVEKIIIGISVQAAVFGLASYYFGLIGWHISSHGLVLPLFSIAAGLAVWWKSG